MKTKTLHFFLLPLQPGKRTRKLTRWRMSLEEGLAKYPGAEPSSFDVLEIPVPETPEEQAAMDGQGHGHGFGMPLWARQPTSARPPAGPDAESGTPPQPPRAA